MKKILMMMLLLCLTLTGCGSGNEKEEYDFDEFSKIYYDIQTYDGEEFSKLTEEEKWGGNTDEDAMTAFANQTHVDFQKEKMKEYGLKHNEPIRVRAKVWKIDDNKEDILWLKSLDDDSDAIFVATWMNDDISDLEEDDVVIIELEFLEEHAGSVINLGNGRIISK